MAEQHTPEVLGVVKAYLTPIVISILGLFIWRDLSELRDDVKYLVKEQNIGTVKIGNLEIKVATLEKDLKDIQDNIYRYPMYAIKEENDYEFKPSKKKK
jgi:hypothetical protein